MLAKPVFLLEFLLLQLCKQDTSILLGSVLAKENKQKFYMLCRVKYQRKVSLSLPLLLMHVPDSWPADYI